jgi:hypothetical protein
VASGGAALVLSRTRAARGLSLLEPDAAGELEAVELEATIALAYCPRCQGRVRVLPCDVLPHKHYSVAVIAAAAGAYTVPDWAESLRSAVWTMLGERTPSHTTLHAWTEGLGAHALGLPAGAFAGPTGGWPFSRVLAEAEARFPEVGSVWAADVGVDPRRYRSEGRRERLAAVARVLAVAETLSEVPPPDALATWRGLIVRGSASFGLCFPTGLLCTGIEHVDPSDRRASRARAPPRSRRCPIPTPSPPGASSKSPP